MKKILIALTILISSCVTSTKNAEEGILYILNKEIDTYRITTYHFQIYDGKYAEWYTTNLETYNKYKIGDTLHTIIIK